MDGIRLGRGIAALRRRRAWRQADLAREAGVSRSMVARVEQGGSDRIPVAKLERTAAALGARLVVRLDWQGEQLDRLIDGRHAALVDIVVRELSRLGWVCAPEATFSIYGERGSIDVLAFHAVSGVLLVIEVKSVIPDMGSMLLALDRKTRLAARIGTERGWRSRATARLLVVADGRTTRRRIDDHAATLSQAFPVRGWAVRRWLASPESVAGWSGLWIPANDYEAVTKRSANDRRPRRQA